MHAPCRAEASFHVGFSCSSFSTFGFCCLRLSAICSSLGVFSLTYSRLLVVLSCIVVVLTGPLPPSLLLVGTVEVALWYGKIRSSGFISWCHQPISHMHKLRVDFKIIINSFTIITTMSGQKFLTSTVCYFCLVVCDVETYEKVLKPVFDSVITLFFKV